MRTMRRRFFGILLSLALVLGMMPVMSVTAYAATNYLSGTVNLSSLKSGDIIGNGVIVSHTNFFNLTIDGENGNFMYNGGGQTWTTPNDKQFKFIKVDNSEMYPRLYATTYIPVYTVTFNKNCSDNVSGLPKNNKSTTNNGKLNLPTLTRSGYVFNGWYTASTNGSFVGNGGATYSPSGNTTLYAGWTAHVHSYTYSATGSTITATCKNTDGAHSGALTQALTIIAPEKTIYGDNNSAEATLDGLSDFNSLTASTVKTSDILYVGVGNTTYQESNTAPTEIGTYRAKITVQGKTAIVEYEIAKPSPGTPTVSMPGYTYGGTVSEPSIGTYLGDGTVTYFFNETDSNSGGVEWKNISNTTLTAGTYYMYATISETDIYASYTSATTAFVVEKATIIDLTAPTAKSLIYTGSEQELINDGSTNDGTLYYAVTTENKAPTDATSYTISIPQKVKAGT